jgi:hypothetical protein
VTEATIGPKPRKEAYTVAEVSRLTGCSECTVRMMFSNEPGVLALERPAIKAKRGYNSIRIPHHVLERVIRRISVK